MHADVLFPISAEAFTYKVPPALESSVTPGCRVRAAFRNRQRWGIVMSCRDDGEGETLISGREIKLKPISGADESGPLIPENLIKLIKWLSWYYLAPAGMALKSVVPPFILEGRRPGKSRIRYGCTPDTPPELRLTVEQGAALDAVNGMKDGVALLHGVTGSGKTEVYIRAIKGLPDEMRAIVLVPEIAVTAQMIDRFRAVFRDEVVFYHSGLSPGERIDAWRRARSGDARVVLGVRSAVFAPFENVGLIVVDEEQEPSYKQFEGLRYNARDTALARGKMEGAKILLGSATPSIEIYHNAKKGPFRYLRLSQRVDDRPMPQVEIIDMSSAEKESFSISRKLITMARENEAADLQTLIMINRRGYSPFFICTDCGYTYKCPSCSITLIYHKDTNTLNCHYCDSHLNPKSICPECGNSRVKCLGTGTQRVEEELEKHLTGVSVSRMDRDTTRRKLSHYRMVKDMEKGRTDILLGTQMVAKGHDFKGVGLAAAISADMALNLPDFRSAERAFQLFTQLAGRAGRGDTPGKAVIQTYEPDHYAFNYVRNHDYEGFYKEEIKLRKELAYPPFSRLVRIIFSFALKPEDRELSHIRSIVRRTDLAGISVLGPAPAPIGKIRRRWRWHIILKGTAPKRLRDAARTLSAAGSAIKGVRIEIDVDPVNLL